VKNSDTFGVLLVDTINSTILNVTSHNSIYGICPVYSSSIDIINCDAYNNKYGIRFYFASNITITNCTSSSNSKDGIYLRESSNNNITYCSSYSNYRYGVHLGYGSSFNLIHHNNFVNNVVNAYDVWPNIWDDNTSEGNYWSDYTGVDEDGDGIGDTPYNISGGDNKDRYPLMIPWDETPPVITDVKATPELQGTIDPVNITCNVIDNVEVDTVKVNVSGPEGFALEAVMNEGYWYEAVYATLGVYYYFIWANDTSGNIAVSDTYSFAITDLFTMSSVDPLQTWTNTVPFTVTATAFDDTEVANVTLYYRYSSCGMEWTEWTSYGTDEEEPWSWSFTGSDGYYEFYSIAIDDYGNVEDPPDVADASTGLDTVLPVTTIILNGIKGEDEWYASDVVITLTASDILSGVESTWYQVDSGYWKLYTTPFTVGDEGEHMVCYYSYDVATNKEVTKCINFKIDKTPPVTTHEFDGIIGKEGWFVSNVTVMLIAADALSGVNYTKYKLDDGDWVTYEESFIVTEDDDHILYYYSVDLAGNEEDVNEVPFKIEHDTKPPVTTHEFDGVMGENNWFVSDVTVTLYAEDDSAGVDYTKYKLDEGNWTEYEGAFPVTEDAEYLLSYYSVDRVGNEENINEVTFKIDQTVPTINLTWDKENSKLVADVSDNTSGIAKVEFYVNGDLVGTVTTAPYEWEVPKPKKGDKGQAIVFDNAGNEAISKEIDAVSQSTSQSQSISSTPVQSTTIKPDIDAGRVSRISGLSEGGLKIL